MSRRTRSIGIWLWAVREWFRGEPELHLLRLFLRDGGVFVDAGANVGIYSLTARRFTREVIAYEPNPDLADDLRIVLGPGDRVRQLAVSDRAGVATLDIPSESGTEVHTRGALAATDGRAFTTTSGRRLEVGTCTLDAEALGSVQLIKIDVEGHEMAALRGAVRTLEHCRPVVVVEAEERHRSGTIDEMRAYFAAHGYSGWFLHRDSVRPFDRFSVDEHQARGSGPGYTERTSPDYVNNFVWIPEERTDLVAALQRFRPRHRTRSVAALVWGNRK